MTKKTGIIYMLLFSIGFYLLYSLWGNVHQLQHFVSSISWKTIVLCMGLVIIGYVFRYYRWMFLLKIKGVDPPHRHSLRIFMIGMSMAISPGKAGELLKTYYLKEACGIEYRISSPVVLMERLTDVLAIICLMAIGCFLFPSGYLWFTGSLFMIVMIFFLLKRPAFLQHVLGWMERKTKKDLTFLKDVHVQFGTLLSLKTTIISTLLGAIAWFIECFVLYLLFQSLGLSYSLLHSIMTFSFGTLLGALTMIPGGIGVSEGSMTGIMMMFSIGKSDAVGITLIIRLLTLWFGTLLGFLVLMFTSTKRSI